MSDPIPDYGPYPPKRPVAWVTWTLLGTTIAVFLLQLLYLHLYGDDVVGNTLAFSPQSFADQRYWTPITYAWVHAVAMFGNSGYFWLHIVANMSCLVCLGPALEDFLGHWRFLGLYLGGVIAAALFWFLLMSSDADPNQGIVGASGAIFALVAGIGVVAAVYPFFDPPLNMILWILALDLCGAELAQMVFGWLPEIAHSAHIGGAIFGFIYVLIIRRFSRAPLLRD